MSQWQNEYYKPGILIPIFVSFPMNHVSSFHTWCSVRKREMLCFFFCPSTVTRGLLLGYLMRSPWLSPLAAGSHSFEELAGTSCCNELALAVSHNRSANYFEEPGTMLASLLENVYTESRCNDIRYNCSSWELLPSTEGKSHKFHMTNIKY